MEYKRLFALIVLLLLTVLFAFAAISIYKWSSIGPFSASLVYLFSPPFMHMQPPNLIELLMKVPIGLVTNLIVFGSISVILFYTKGEKRRNLTYPAIAITAIWSLVGIVSVLMKSYGAVSFILIFLLYLAFLRLYFKPNAKRLIIAALWISFLTNPMAILLLSYNPYTYTTPVSFIVPLPPNGAWCSNGMVSVIISNLASRALDLNDITAKINGSLEDTDCVNRGLLPPRNSTLILKNCDSDGNGTPWPSNKAIEIEIGIPESIKRFSITC